MTERQTAPLSPGHTQPVSSPPPVGYVYANGAPQGDRPTEGLNREFVDALITVCSDHRAKGTLVVGVHADLLETLARFAERLLLLESREHPPKFDSSGNLLLVCPSCGGKCAVSLTL